jgi:hypothetical protein
MANPASPVEAGAAKLGYGIADDGAGADQATLPRMLNPGVVDDETDDSGSLAVASMTLHDAVDVAAEGPVKIGGVADSTRPTAVADGDRVNAAYDLQGAAHTLPFPATQGGLSTFNGTSSDGGTALTSTAQAVKASAGQLYGWFIYNPNDEVSYVNVYNVAAASVTVGTTNPLFHIPIPAGQGANVAFPFGIAFSTAISAAATKTAGSNTAPDTAMEVVLFYA